MIHLETCPILLNHFSEPCGTDNSFSPLGTRPLPYQLFLLSHFLSQFCFLFSSLVGIPLASLFTFSYTLCRQLYSFLALSLIFMIAAPKFLFPAYP